MTVYRRPDPIPLRRVRAATPAALDAVRSDVDDLYHLVLRRLITAIVGGRFAEGSILPNEQVLADDLGVSRTALREAMKGLTAKGLVEVKRRRGTLVLPRGSWNMLDGDVVAAMRAADGRRVSEEQWAALLAVMPVLAEAAALRRGTDQSLSGDLIAAAETPTAQLQAKAGFLLGVAQAADNRFLCALASVSLASLVAQDEIWLARQLGGFGVAEARRLARAIEEGRASDAGAIVAGALAERVLVATGS